MNFPAVRGRTRPLTVPGITRTTISPQTTLCVSSSHLFPDAHTDRGPSVRGRSASDESTATEPELPGVVSAKASDRPGVQASKAPRWCINVSATEMDRIVSRTHTMAYPLLLDLRGQQPRGRGIE